MKYCITLIFSISYFVTLGQSFGTLGTEWEHCIIPIFEFPVSYDKVKVKSVTSFSMNGLECNELEIQHKPNTMTTHDKISVCRDGDKVFYIEDDSLYLIYDFSVASGQVYTVRYPVLFDTTFQYYFPNESIYTLVTVDSIVLENINGVELRKQFISTQGAQALKFGNYALERIGYENWLLPFYSFDASETNTFSGLINYMDGELEIVENSANCLSLSILDTQIEQNVEIYPNPAVKNIEIKLNGLSIEFIEFISIDGLLLKRINISGNDRISININDWARGIYLIKFLGNEQIFSKKLVIH